MPEQTIAIAAAGMGVIGTVVWIVLWRKGIRSLQEIRDELRKSNSG